MIAGKHGISTFQYEDLIIVNSLRSPIGDFIA